MAGCPVVRKVARLVVQRVAMVVVVVVEAKAAGSEVKAGREAMAGMVEKEAPEEAEADVEVTEMRVAGKEASEEVRADEEGRKNRLVAMGEADLEAAAGAGWHLLALRK